MANQRLVFIHGAGGSPLSWSEQMSEWPRADYVTLPGHRANETFDNGGYNNVAAYTEWLREYLVAEHNVDGVSGKLVLVGHSMGGAIAMNYCLRYGEEVAGLVLAATSAHFIVSPAFLEGFKQNYPATVHQVINLGYGTHAKEHQVRESREHMEQLDPAVTYGDFEACANFNITDQVGQLGKQPTLVVGGQQDKMTPSKMSQFLGENIPGARLEMLDAGHYVMQEQGAKFNELLTDFLKGI